MERFTTAPLIPVCQYYPDPLRMLLRRSVFDTWQINIINGGYKALFTLVICRT